MPVSKVATLILASDSKLATWQVVLFSSLFCLTCVTGLLCLFQGFRTYRDLRLNRSTPPSAIGSVAPGLVKVRGKAHCSEPVLAPFSRTPCCYYKTKIEYLAEKGPLDDQRYIYGWRELRSDVGGKPFFMVDSTGTVLIDAPSMFADELDARSTFDQKVDQSLLPLNEYRGKLGDGDAATLDQAVQAAMLSRTQSSDDGESTGPSGKASFRLIEWAVLPGEEYLVIGNYGENPAAKGSHVIGRAKGMPFGMSHRVEKSDYDWAEVLRSQARSNLLVGILALFGGMIFLVPLVKYWLARQHGLE